MALEEASAPPSQRNLKGIVEEIQRDGISGTWYFVTSYDIVSSARTQAYDLRSRFPDLDIRAEAGSILARRKA